VAIVPASPELPANTIEVTGVLWPDDQDGYLRVYFSPELDRFVRVAAQDVVGSREFDPPEADFCRRLVYITENAPLEHTRVTSLGTQMEFLAGDLFAGVAPQLRSSGQSMLGLSDFAANQPIRADRQTILICTLIFGCSRGCPSDVSLCLCSGQGCSQGRNCCRGTIGSGSCG
jgi:hypothetical protein